LGGETVDLLAAQVERGEAFAHMLSINGVVLVIDQADILRIAGQLRDPQGLELGIKSNILNADMTGLLDNVVFEAAGARHNVDAVVIVMAGRTDRRIAAQDRKRSNGAEVVIAPHAVERIVVKPTDPTPPATKPITVRLPRRARSGIPAVPHG